MPLLPLQRCSAKWRIIFHPISNGGVSVFFSRRAETALSALGLGQFGDLLDLHVQHRRDDHLGDAHAALDDEILLAVVDHDDLHFALLTSVVKQLCREDSFIFCKESILVSFIAPKILQNGPIV